MIQAEDLRDMLTKACFYPIFLVGGMTCLASQEHSVRDEFKEGQLAGDGSQTFAYVDAQRDVRGRAPAIFRSYVTLCEQLI